MRTVRLLVLVLAAVLLVGSALPTAAAQDDLRAAIEAANARFAAAVAAGDAAAVAGMYTADGWLMAPNAPTATGHEAIAAAFQGMLDMGVTSVSLITDEVHGAGAMAHEVGRYVIEGADGAHMDHGKYIVIWHHTEDGWKLHRDIYNSDMAPPAQ